MPKLNTTLDKIETVNNKVIGTTASPEWTDAQYPSAKTLYNVYNRLSNEVNAKYPVDSIVCMASNTNPSMAGIPGTWTLIDKEFKHTWLTINSGAWTATNAAFYAGNVALYGHEIMVRLQIKPNANPGDNTTVMGKLNFAHSSIGLPSSLYFGRSQGIATSDGHNATMCYDFTPDGTITSYDCLNVDGTHSLYLPSTYYLTFTDYFTCEYTGMPDTYCNKFYFKRIA